MMQTIVTRNLAASHHLIGKAYAGNAARPDELEVLDVSAFRIIGGGRISGEVDIDCAKNAVLPILAAALLTREPVKIIGCPDMLDVNNMLAIMSTLGCRCMWEEDGALIDSGTAHCFEMPDDLSKSLRSSIFMMGSILSRFRRATVTYPGGCEIGLRPIDLHLKGLRALGVMIEERHGMIYCDGSRMHAGTVHMDFPSVGATENVMLAAVLIKGRTEIHNAAREPEIVDLGRMINAMGGRVSGAGTQTIVIEGVDELRGITYKPIGDRIVAGTLMVGAAMTGGRLTVRGVEPLYMGAILDKFRETGCAVTIRGDAITIASSGRLRGFRISTHPFPGFPTDMQAQMMAMACVAHGSSVVVENVFESRFAHASQLLRMGANITVEHRTAVIEGGAPLTGARVYAKDLRGGAALVLAGIVAEGVTEVYGAHLIDRGYVALEKTLRALGANVERIADHS